jgi:hypothetical protein
VYRELRAIRERAEARDVEEQIQAAEERLRRAIGPGLSGSGLFKGPREITSTSRKLRE